MFIAKNLLFDSTYAGTVTYSAVGAGNKTNPTGATQTYSWTQTVASTDTAVVAGFDLFVTAAGTINSITATCASNSMTVLNTTVHSGSSLSRTTLFGLLVNQTGAPTVSGSVTITVTLAWASSNSGSFGQANSSAYKGARSFGTVAASTGSSPDGTLISLSVPSPILNSRIAQFNILSPSSTTYATAITSYNQTTDWSSVSSQNAQCAFLLGDAAGGGTITFTWTLSAPSSSGANFPWSALAIPLIP